MELESLKYKIGSHEIMSSPPSVPPIKKGLTKLVNPFFIVWRTLEDSPNPMELTLPGVRPCEIVLFYRKADTILNRKHYQSKNCDGSVNFQRKLKVIRRNKFPAIIDIQFTLIFLINTFNGTDFFF